MKTEWPKTAIELIYFGIGAIVFILTVAMLVGCSTIDSHKPPPKGWPTDIVIVEHMLTLPAAISHCYHAVPLGQKLIGTVAFACNTVNLYANRCDIYRTAWTTTAQMDEEYDHCLGRDHIGETTLADYYAEYTKRVKQ